MISRAKNLVRAVRSRAARALGSGAGERPLTWAIKVPAPDSPEGDVWGDVFYAEDLCARYFTYRRGGQTHFVLFDDAGTLRRKIEMGQALGIREGFVMLPEVEDLTGSLFTGEG